MPLRYDGWAAALTLAFWGCGDPSSCGPSRARVERVVDGDTVVLEGGERVRYLLVDAPEASRDPEACYAREATHFNRELVEGRMVELDFDGECRDVYGRLLAFVSVGGFDVNRGLIERGYACFSYIAPGGGTRAEAFRSLETEARASARGLWGACTSAPCAR
jgi:micrococcal nuclease